VPRREDGTHPCPLTGLTTRRGPGQFHSPISKAEDQILPLSLDDWTADQGAETLTLIRNCLCRCWLCNVNLSTAYANLSFFCLSAFNLSPISPPPVTTFPLLPRELRADPVPPPCPNLPSWSSLFATSACSLRSSLAQCVSTRCSKVVIAGRSSEAREAWAAVREEEGVSSKCWVGRGYN
jgi:hypothetical protein